MSRQVIFKYPLPDMDNTLELPSDYKFLDVGTQNDVPMIWIRHNADKSYPKLPCRLIMVNTGEEVSDKWQYLGTVHLREKTIVHHIHKIG